MNKTKIEWVKNPDGSQGYTWNPITGCLNGCEYCYARKLANGRLKSRYLANRHVPYYGFVGTTQIYVAEAQKVPFSPRFWPDRMRWLSPRYAGSRHLSKPRGIFVSDMGDLFGLGVPESWTAQVLNAIKLWPEHRFYLLTKQPQNLIKFSPFPDNCWVGVTATDRRYFNIAIGNLAQIKARVRFISFEPLLDTCQHQVIPYLEAVFKEGNLDWVIIGAQTKPYKPPKIEWVEEIVRACDKAGIPVFLKDNLKPLLENDHRTFINPLYWKNGYYTCPEHPNIDLWLRQEMPK